MSKIRREVSKKSTYFFGVSNFITFIGETWVSTFYLNFYFWIALFQIICWHCLRESFLDEKGKTFHLTIFTHENIFKFSFENLMSKKIWSEKPSKLVTD